MFGCVLDMNIACQEQGSGVARLLQLPLREC